MKSFKIKELIFNEFTVIRVFYTVIWTVLLVNVWSCGTNGKKFDALNNTTTTETYSVPLDTSTSNVPVDTTTPVTIKKQLSPVTQLRAIGDSITSTVSTVTSSEEMEVKPTSDIESDDFKYEYRVGKYYPVELYISKDDNSVTIKENKATSTYTIVPPITTVQGNKSRTETFTMKDVQGNTYPTAFFFKGQSETPWAVRLPKRTLFSRMPVQWEFKAIMKNSAIAPKPCPCTQWHTIEAGTNANGIAAYRKTTLENLKKLNPGIDLTKLSTGKKLCLAKKCK
jgi:hypothetical protein